MLIVAAGITLIVLMLILLPFFLGAGGLLQSASAIDSLEQLFEMRQAILKRYLEDEAAFGKKLLSASVWDNRKLFLTHRYIDIVRRIDFLKDTAQARQGGVKG